MIIKTGYSSFRFSISKEIIRSRNFQLQNDKNKDNKNNTQDFFEFPRLLSEPSSSEIHLILSLFLPSQQKLDRALIEEFTDWIIYEYMCFARGIHLVSDLKSMQSFCLMEIEDESVSSKAIIHNLPRTTSRIERLGDSTLRFTRLNITFPIFENRDAELESKLQSDLDWLIEEGDITSPWEGSLLAVAGQEISYYQEYLFDQSIEDNGYNINMQSENTFLKEYSPVYLQGIGCIVGIINTILLIILHVFGKSYIKQKKIQRTKKRRRKDLMSAQGVNLMLDQSRMTEKAQFRGSDISCSPYSVPKRQPSALDRRLTPLPLESRSLVCNSLLMKMHEDNNDEEEDDTVIFYNMTTNIPLIIASNSLSYDTTSENDMEEGEMWA
jgi:hypothetical protein